MAKTFLVPIDLTKQELQNARVQNLSTAPSSPVTGQLYYDTDDNILYYWNGSGWISAAGGGIPATTVDAKGDLIAGTADNTVARLAVGADDTILMADSGQATGLKWVASATPSTVGTANSAGTADTFSRGDHVHAHEAAHINHDTTWAAKGDLISGSANDTAVITTVGADDTVLMADAAAGGGIKWVASQTPGTATFGQAAAQGTADTYARGDHAHGMPAHDDAAHNTVELNDLAAADGNYSMGGNLITNHGTPSAGTDVANKAYVDATAAGIDWKASVRAATTAAGTLASSFENTDVIDGVTLATGDRILIKNQAAPAENGIYTVNASGAPTRATDADVSAEVSAGMAVFVEQGTANADTGWVLTTDGAITLGTTGLTFTQFTGLGMVTAGAGLTQTGSTIDAVAGTGITVNANDIQVTRTDANGRVPIKFAANIGDNSATSFNVDHNLNSLDVLVSVYRVSDGAQVECDTTVSTVNRVILAFAVAPTSNQYRVVVYG